MVCRNLVILRKDDVWFYKCEQTQVGNSFYYLRLLLKYNGKFHVTQKQLSLQCTCMNALRKYCNESFNTVPHHKRDGDRRPINSRYFSHPSNSR